MNERWWIPAGAIFAGGTLGTAARVGLLGLIGHEVVALAAINLTGALLLGLISGYFGGRVTVTRLFLAVGGLAAFTSWSSLALQGLAPGGVVIAVAETALGVIVAGMGYLGGMKLRRADDE